ncbi:integrin alpha FG-GAP repeat-containing protein 2 [Homalodisca vitripennis]|nr:integrin alpha FG-GAP repeat-containing protein 2 [Homalodisca vitripennis]
MRSVCFVDHIEFEFSGSVSKNAIAIGDVDNDGEIELIVGNMNGEVAIYKHDKCWQKISNLGMITAIGVGDVMNCGSNALVIVCGDGWCHICLCLHPKFEDSEESAHVKLEPVHVQRIPPNTKTGENEPSDVTAREPNHNQHVTTGNNLYKYTSFLGFKTATIHHKIDDVKVIILEDVDGDGTVEMVVGLTDRVVRSYRWVQNATGGRLVCLYKWECANQIGGLAINHDPNGAPKLLVAQPGGTIMKINPEIILGSEEGEEQIERNENPLLSSVEYHPLMVSRMRNPSISTEIIADVSEGPESTKEKGLPYVVATLDGTLMFVKNEEIIW